MSNKEKRLGDRKDFWNIPVNPITGYRIKGLNGNGEKKEIKEHFFNDTTEGPKWK